VIYFCLVQNFIINKLDEKKYEKMDLVSQRTPKFRTLGQEKIKRIGNTINKNKKFLMENKMSNWEKVVENNMNFWIHEELGTIVEIEEGKYVVMYPKVLKLGIFQTVEQAQEVIETNVESLNNFIEHNVDKFNYELFELMKKTEEKK